MMGKLVLLTCLCFISSIAGKSLKFTTQQWTLPGTTIDTPPIKFVDVGDSVNISCKTNDKHARVELFLSPGMIARYVSAVKYYKGRIKKSGQIFMIKKVMVHDHGRYKCVANTVKDSIALRTVLVKGLLMVRVPMNQKILPKIIPNKRNLQMKQGSNFEIKCKSSGIPGKEKSYLTWHRKNDNGNVEDVESSNVERLELVMGGVTLDVEVLKFKGFNQKDVGEYICKRAVPGGYVTISKIKLTMKGYCSFDGKLHKIGDSFVSLSCTGVCRCYDMNSVGCVSLCPPHFVNCPPGEIEVSLPRQVSTSPKCFCKQKQCVNISDHCYFEEKLYTKNQPFVSKSCASCKCDGFNSVSCVSMCPPSITKCLSDEMIHYSVKQTNKSPRCYCKKQICVKITDVCKMNPDSGPCYALFNRWHYNSSSRSCERFHYGGCDGNPNRFVRKRICENVCSMSSSHHVYSSVASLPRVSGDCKFEGMWYRKGEQFISKNCKRKCRCADVMSIKCKLICTPPIPVTCPVGTMAVSSPKVVTKSPRCFCVVKRCVSTSDICKMKPEGGSCYAHIRRWYYNPSLQSCESFIYGGCEGNPNNFEKKMICRDTCIRKDKIGNTGNKVFAVSGKILFSPGVGTLPKSSCASVKLIDRNSKTGRGTSSTSFVVSEMDTSHGIKYHLMYISSYTPSSNKTYTLSAVVNVGWCKDQYSFHWVKKGDYVTRNISVIKLGEKEKYKVDITVSQI